MYKLLLYATIVFLNVFLILSGYLITDVAFNHFKFELDWGFIGALLGGFISGGLTLVGVRLSIKASFDGIKATMEHQEMERLKETIGVKLNNLYKVKKIIYKLDSMLSNREYGWDEKCNKADAEKIDSDILYFLLPELNNLLELSSSVDWEFYNEIKTFVGKTREYLIVSDKKQWSELTEYTDKLTNAIQDTHEKRLSEIFKEASTKNIL